MEMFKASHVDVWYGQLMRHLLVHGSRKENERTGTGTLSCSGGSVRFDLADRFPALTLKKTGLDAAFGEIECFIKGQSADIGWLHDRGIHIWDEWADHNTGQLGPVYGVQWRAWKAPAYHDGNRIHDERTIDQLAILVDDLRNDPWSRRMIVEGWNVADLPLRGVDPHLQGARGKMALPPCPKSFQCVMRKPHAPVMDLVLYIRSSDSFLGLPFNIAQYAFLAHALARSCGAAVGDLIVHFGDVHLYLNHVDQAGEVVRRYNDLNADLVIDGPDSLANPQLVWANDAPLLPWDIDTRKDLFINHYFPQAHIAGKVAV